MQRERGRDTYAYSIYSTLRVYSAYGLGGSCSDGLNGVYMVYYVWSVQGDHGVYGMLYSCIAYTSIL